MRPYNKSYYQPPRQRPPQRRRKVVIGRFIPFIIIAAAIVVGIIFAVMYFTDSGLFVKKADPISEPTATPAPYTAQADSEGALADDPDAEDEDASAAQDATAPAIAPAAVDSTQPSAFGFETDIEVNGEIAETFTRPNPIKMPSGSAYTELKGITTLRGNNFRDMSGYGAADVTNKELGKAWTADISSLTRWTGAGYPSQPLVVQWDADMRQMMNLYEDKKSKDTLVEVIYPTMDGHIYFLDLDDGSYTRDPIEMGFSVKGTAAIDPRGYPLLYVGQGVGMSGDFDWDDTYMYAYSLIDGEILWKYGAEVKDPFALRESWQAYDSSPLIAENADTLIWPGENGVLYTVVLNTEFDRAAGTVSISAEEPVKYRYNTPENQDDEAGLRTRWWGIEGSASAWNNYLYFTDNGGWLQCIDLNTMELVFAQDVKDDADCSPVLEEDGDNLYLYTGTEAKRNLPEGEEFGTAYARKINALTGEVLWEKEYGCHYVDGVTGGVMATPILGQGDMDNLIVFTVARTEKKDTGIIVAYDRNTGDEVWKQDMKHYAWSSPVTAYTTDGTGYILQGDSNGNITLYQGSTGEELDKLSIGSGNMEATPIMFNDMMVVGTRSEEIVGIRLS